MTFLLFKENVVFLRLDFFYERLVLPHIFCSLSLAEVTVKLMSVVLLASSSVQILVLDNRLYRFLISCLLD